MSLREEKVAAEQSFSHLEPRRRAGAAAPAADPGPGSTSSLSLFTSEQFLLSRFIEKKSDIHCIFAEAAQDSFGTTFN